MSRKRTHVMGWICATILISSCVGSVDSAESDSARVALSNGTVCGTAKEGGTITLACPSGQIISSVGFASYGTPSGPCGAFTAGTCNASRSVSVVSSACIGKSTCRVSANRSTFGDPCVGTAKRLYAQVTCAGATGTGGAAGTGGATGTGTPGTGGAIGTGGTTGTGSSAATGTGTPGTGGAIGTGGTTGTGDSAATCTGTGLLAEYYNGSTFDTLALTRIDPTVDFDWGSGSAASSVNVDQFSARWTGQVQPLYSETYTFSTESDDGIRLWVNGQQLIEAWAEYSPTQNSGTIALAAGQKYNLKIEYHENSGGAISKLSWSSSSQAKQIVPQSQLYPAVGGSTGTGGASGTGGMPGTGGSTGAGGNTGAGSALATGSNSGTGGTTGLGGNTGAGSAAGTAGTPGTAGSTGAAGSTGIGGASGTGGKSGTGGSTIPVGGSTGNCAYTSTIQLIGNQIRDTSGASIVARGPELVTASTDQTAAIDAAAIAGANAIRLLLTLDAVNGMTPATFDTLIGQAVSHNMIVWLSLFNWDTNNNYVIGSALGGGNFYSLAAPDGNTCSKTTPAPCFLAVWSRQWLKDLVAKYKGHVIIDAGQEYIGVADPATETGRTEWANAAQSNVRWFRSAGYTVPLEIMANYQGRDLYGIIEKGASIRAVDTVVVSGYPQTMFGWQAYWASDWYKGWQGGLLLGGSSTITGAQAIHQFAVTQQFPIEIGLDNYAGDTSAEYKAEMDQAAADRASWLWWSWTGSNTAECPNDGATCQAYVTGSQSGFAGAVRSTCGL